jgi:hypothetical protein
MVVSRIIIDKNRGVEVQGKWQMGKGRELRVMYLLYVREGREGRRWIVREMILFITYGQEGSGSGQFTALD